MVLHSDVQVLNVIMELTEAPNEVAVLLVQICLVMVLENLYNLSNLALRNIRNDDDVLLQR